MSNRLAREIAQLASESQDFRIYDQAVIKELTMIVGYAHMLETNYTAFAGKTAALRKHVQAFSNLVNGHGHRDLFAHSERILELLDREPGFHDAA
jgi:hypothetical protein